MSIVNNKSAPKKRGQFSFEFIIVVALATVVLALTLTSVRVIQKRSADMSSIVQSRNVVNSLSSAVNLVASQGCPARKSVQVYMPPGVKISESYIGSETDSLGHIVNIHVVTPYGEEDVYAYTSALINGSFPSSLGFQTLVVQNNCDHIRIGQPSAVIVPSMLSVVLLEAQKREYISIQNTGDLTLYGLSLAPDSNLDSFFSETDPQDISLGEKKNLYLDFAKGNHTSGNYRGNIIVKTSSGSISSIPTLIQVMNFTKYQDTFCTENPTICSDPAVDCTTCEEMFSWTQHSQRVYGDTFIGETSSLDLISNVKSQEDKNMPGLVLMLSPIVDSEGNTAYVGVDIFTDEKNGNYTYSFDATGELEAGHHYVTKVTAENDAANLQTSRGFYVTPPRHSFSIISNKKQYNQGESAFLYAYPRTNDCNVSTNWNVTISDKYDIASGADVAYSSSFTAKSCYPFFSDFGFWKSPDGLQECKQSYSQGDDIVFKWTLPSTCGISFDLTNNRVKVFPALRDSGTYKSPPGLVSTFPQGQYLKSQTIYTTPVFPTDTWVDDWYYAQMYGTGATGSFFWNDMIKMGTPDWDFYIDNSTDFDEKRRCFAPGETLNVKIDLTEVDGFDSLDFTSVTYMDQCNSFLGISDTLSGSNGEFTFSRDINSLFTALGSSHNPVSFRIYLRDASDGNKQLYYLGWTFEINPNGCSPPVDPQGTFVYNDTIKAYVANVTPDSTGTYVFDIDATDGFESHSDSIYLHFGEDDEVNWPIPKDVSLSMRNYWWDSDYLYRRSINVTNPYAIDLRGHPVEKTIYFRNKSVVNCTKELHLFYNEDELPLQLVQTQYRDSYCYSATILFTTNITAASSKILHLYYGNPNATASRITGIKQSSGNTEKINTGIFNFEFETTKAFTKCEFEGINVCKDDRGFSPETPDSITIDKIALEESGPVRVKYKIDWTKKIDGSYPLELFQNVQDHVTFYYNTPYVYFNRTRWISSCQSGSHGYRVVNTRLDPTYFTHELTDLNPIPRTLTTDSCNSTNPATIMSAAFDPNTNRTVGILANRPQRLSDKQGCGIGDYPIETKFCSGHYTATNFVELKMGELASGNWFSNSGTDGAIEYPFWVYMGRISWTNLTTLHSSLVSPLVRSSLGPEIGYGSFSNTDFEQDSVIKFILSKSDYNGKPLYETWDAEGETIVNENFQAVSSTFCEDNSNASVLQCYIVPGKISGLGTKSTAYFSLTKDDITLFKSQSFFTYSKKPHYTELRATELTTLKNENKTNRMSTSDSLNLYFDTYTSTIEPTDFHYTVDSVVGSDDVDYGCYKSSCPGGSVQSCNLTECSFVRENDVMVITFDKYVEQDTIPGRYELVDEIGDFEFESQQGMPVRQFTGPHNLAFDNSGEVYMLYHSDELELSQGTLSFWFNVTDLSKSRIELVNKDWYSDATPGLFSIYIDSNDKPTVSIANGTGRINVTSPQAVLENTWYHLAFSWGPSGVMLFVNGTLVASSSLYTDGIDKNEENIFLGNPGYFCTNQDNSWYCDGPPDYDQRMEGSFDMLRVSSAQETNNFTLGEYCNAPVDENRSINYTCTISTHTAPQKSVSLTINGERKNKTIIKKSFVLDLESTESNVPYELISFAPHIYTGNSYVTIKAHVVDLYNNSLDDWSVYLDDCALIATNGTRFTLRSPYCNFFADGTTHILQINLADFPEIPRNAHYYLHIVANSTQLPFMYDIYTTQTITFRNKINDDSLTHIDVSITDNLVCGGTHSCAISPMSIYTYDKDNSFVSGLLPTLSLTEYCPENEGSRSPTPIVSLSNRYEYPSSYDLNNFGYKAEEGCVYTLITRIYDGLVPHYDTETLSYLVNPHPSEIQHYSCLDASYLPSSISLVNITSHVLSKRNTTLQEWRITYPGVMDVLNSSYVWTNSDEVRNGQKEELNVSVTSGRQLHFISKAIHSSGFESVNKTFTMANPLLPDIPRVWMPQLDYVLADGSLDVYFSLQDSINQNYVTDWDVELYGIKQINGTYVDLSGLSSTDFTLAGSEYYKNILLTDISLNETAHVVYVVAIKNGVEMFDSTTFNYSI